jgi:trehalose-phosphatase
MQRSRVDTCLTPARYDAAVFDLDGVITRTAEVHAAAWKAMFDDVLAAHATDAKSARPFDLDRDYRRYVDGKPRDQGVRSFLEARGIALPEGEPDDSPDRDTLYGLGKRKNQLFLDHLARHGAEVYASSVRFVKALRAAGMRTAVVSSSRNCARVLAAAAIGDLFDTRVDGVDLERQRLAGKPAPDMFVEASRRLGAEAARSLGVEDALAGVEAIRAAGFGLVIGVDRDGQAEALAEHGADIVVNDLGELQLAKAGALPSALAHVDDILAQGRRPALFLDYDGTLTPIVADPAQALLGEATRAVLRRLAGLCPVPIISGRDLADVRDRVDLPGIWYAGSHGFDIAGPGGERDAHQQGTAFLPLLDAAEQTLNHALDKIPGVHIERKRFSLAVHYRQVPDSALETVRQLVERVHGEHPRLRLAGGKKIHELQPDIDWDKGAALQWLMRRQALDPTDHLPIYIGDDVTDEDAFRALASGGVGIRVGDDPACTRAAYGLDDPDAVCAFLERLAERLRRQGR